MGRIEPPFPARAESGGWHSRAQVLNFSTALGILALACIALGFIGEIIDEHILLGTLEWFVAAIAFNTLGSLPFVKKR